MSEIRWIVLVRKSPKGPFSTAEVEGLIQQGLIRRNDVAFQVLEGSTKAATGWKFIWQFPEFERRGGKVEIKPHEPQQDRRTTPKVQAGRVSEEILAILPEDLIFKSEREIPLREEVETPVRKRPLPLGWVFTGSGLAAFALYWFWPSPEPSPVPIRLPTSVVSPPRAAPAAEKARAARESPPVAPVMPSPVAREEPPRPPDDSRKEPVVSDSGYRDPDEAELDREPASDEDEEPVIIRKKKKKRPAIVIEDDEEYSDEEPPPEE